MGQRRSATHWFNLVGIGSVVLALLAGCTGNDGAQGPAGPAGSNAGVVTDASTLSTTDLQNLSITATVTSVSIASPPVVNFTLKDANGKGITGLGFTRKRSSDPLPALQNIQFALAKLVPADATTGAPSKWVSYIVTNVPSSGSPSPQRPGTDTTGTLVDHGDGSYTYTFYRDVTQTQALLNAYNTAKYGTATPPVTDNIADLGDTTYNANAITRLVIQVGGTVRGTGTNTADGSASSIASMSMLHPIDVVYDFIPATGAKVAADDANGREIVNVQKCFECHTKFTWHGGDELTGAPGTRQETRYCVVCHSDQRKYGRAEATTTATGYSGSTYRINGMAVGNLPVLVHKIHMGEDLAKDGYNFANVLFNEVTFPQDKRNCTKCHDGTTGAPNATAQGDHWKTNPSRLACGACHDNVDFATGANHPGGVQLDDHNCTLCHSATNDPVTGNYAPIPTVHTPVADPNPANSLTGTGSPYTNAAWIAPNLNNLPAGAATIAYNVQSVSVDASNHPVIVFKITDDGADVVFNAGPTGEMMGPDAKGNTFVGSPSVQFVWAVAQDGISNPSDFNGAASGYLKAIWNGTATGSGAGTMTGPDASGFYTVTLTGTTVDPAATMLTGGIGFGYALNSTPPLTQTNLADYPYPDTINQGGTAGTGGLIVEAPVVWKTATGSTARRAIVDTTRCNKCHQQLGANPTFHAGQRNNGQVCAFCHNPNRTSSGWSARSSSFVHGIHSSAKRTVPFTWHEESPTAGFFDITFPGILKNCQACHLPGMYDFSSSVYTSTLMNNMLYSTVATRPGTTATTYPFLPTPAADPSLSPYVDQTGTVDYGDGFSVSASTGTITPAAATTLVTSPIATACFACHDSSVDKSHMEQNGASIYEARSTALAKTEQCLVCHGPGRVAAIADVHAN